MAKGYAWKRRKFWRFGRRERVQRNVKDRLFRFLFEKDREALLQLYNALNGTDYRDASQLEIVTIDSAIFDLSGAGISDGYRTGAGKYLWKRDIGGCFEEKTIAGSWYVTGRI